MGSKSIKPVTLFAFALSLACAPGAEATTVITFLPASDYNSNVTTMDATLGITGFVEDTFESTALIPGLTETLGGSITPITSTTLPNLFNPNTQGDGFETNNQWDGSDVADNSTTNRLLGNPTPYASLITFNYASGATAFGVGLSGFQSTNSPEFPITNHELFVNGVDMGMIETLAGANWSPGIVRNAYLLITATGGSTITSVGFENLNTTQEEDFMIFDHLALQQAVSSAPEPSTVWMLLAGTTLCAVSRLRR